MKELNARLNELVEAINVDQVKFEEKGNHSASVRVRKHLQEIINLSKDYRKAIVAARENKK